MFKESQRERWQMWTEVREPSNAKVGGNVRDAVKRTELSRKRIKKRMRVPSDYVKEANVKHVKEAML